MIKLDKMDLSDTEREMVLKTIQDRMDFNRAWARKKTAVDQRPTVDAVMQLEQERVQADAKWKKFLSVLEGL